MMAGMNNDALNTVLSAGKYCHYRAEQSIGRNLMQAPMQPDQFNVIKRQFAGSNDAFQHHNAVFQEISDRMLARLELLAIVPSRVLDLGCRDGYQLDALQSRFPKAHVIGADPAGSSTLSSGRWWQRRPANRIITADPHKLPFADGCFDLLVSNMLLPWCHDPAAVFAEAARVLSENGAFMFTSAGPDTLQEYAHVWEQIDASQHVFGLVDMHKTGDEMLTAGFAAPVLDRETILVDYASIGALQDELRRVGAANVAIGRRTGLMSGAVRKLLSNIEHTGRFKVTLELVQGHGWKGALSSSRKNSADEFSVSLDSLRQSLRGSTK